MASAVRFSAYILGRPPAGSRSLGWSLPLGIEGLVDALLLAGGTVSGVRFLRWGHVDSTS